MRFVQRGGSSLLIVLILAVGAFFYVWIYHPALLGTVLKASSSGTATSGVQFDNVRMSNDMEIRWQTYYRPHTVCGRERTELERLECRNDRDNQRIRFEARWREAVAKGTKF